MTGTKMMIAGMLLMLGTAMPAKAGGTPEPPQDKKEAQKKSRQLEQEGWAVYGQQQPLADALTVIYRQTDEGLVQVTGFGQAETEALAVRKATLHATRQHAAMTGSVQESSTRSEGTADGGETLLAGSTSETSQKVKPLKPALTLTRRRADGTVEAQVFCLVGAAKGQRETTVSGRYSYTVSDNDNITLKAAKHKCIELAKAEAIKAEFGELITSDVIDSNAETNGEAASSFFWENTVAMARGEWLADATPPHISVDYADGKLRFTAEVSGLVREIVQSETQLKWEILKDVNDKKVETTDFKSGERIYINFKSPADGYVAVYLIQGENETSCLLPYRRDPAGRVAIKRGQQYEFFDKQADPSASYYKLNTQQDIEYNQLVVIYSPNPFTKCIDNVGDPRHPNSLNTREFQKWLLHCQRADRDMVVKKKWVQITQGNR